MKIEPSLPLNRRRPAARAPMDVHTPLESVQLSGGGKPSSGTALKAQGLSLAVGASAQAGGSPQASLTASETLKVLSLNIWLDGKGGRDQIVEVIRQSKADVVGLQESGEATRPIAQALGYDFVQQDTERAVLSRLPITAQTPNKDGVMVRLDSGKEVAVFNIHPYYFPYQPYQLMGIPYMDSPFLKTEQEAIDSATQARGKDIERALQDLSSLAPDQPVVLTGDFNEPSHLDWTERTAAAGRHPIKVAWPATKALAEAGLKDAYRAHFPDEMSHPGYTWTPTTAPDDPKDHHDRIDFVMSRGPGIEVESVDVLGENAENASVVVAPYPTDHRGVLATFKVQQSS